MLPVRPLNSIRYPLIERIGRRSAVSAIAAAVAFGVLSIGTACRTAPRTRPAPELCLGQEVLAVNNLTQRSVDVYEVRGGNSRIIGTVGSLVGGADAASINLIGNAEGVGLRLSGCSGCSVRHNRIGVGVNGYSDLGNGVGMLVVEARINESW